MQQLSHNCCCLFVIKSLCANNVQLRVLLETVFFPHPTIHMHVQSRQYQLCPVSTTCKYEQWTCMTQDASFAQLDSRKAFQLKEPLSLHLFSGMTTTCSVSIHTLWRSAIQRDCRMERTALKLL